MVWYIAAVIAFFFLGLLNVIVKIPFALLVKISMLSPEEILFACVL
jgi:hypothetical protein